MISRACYVKCDSCGWPAEVACIDGAKEARQLARQKGFTRSKGRDYCPQCTERRREATKVRPQIGGVRP